jgi:carboxylesterase type B
MNTPLTTTWGPVVDGKIITRQHTESIKRGQFRKIPIMLTTSNDEALLFLVGFPLDTKEQANKFARRVFPFMNENDLKTIDKLYPTTNSFSQPLDDAMSDFYFNCPARRLAKTYAAHKLPVFKGLFSKVSSNQDYSMGLLNPTFSKKRVPVIHGADVPFVILF